MDDFPSGLRSITFEIEINRRITQSWCKRIILLAVYNESDSSATEAACNPVYQRDPNNYLIDTVTNDFINVATQRIRVSDFSPNTRGLSRSFR